MTTIPKKVLDRLGKTIGPYQRILNEAKRRDVNESNTVTIVTDMLADVFGWDKYSEVTSEQAIRGTFCDLAIVIDGSIQFLIEVKAIGLGLKENHLRQAVAYGANQGVPWIVLTNGIIWRVYRLKFEQPISHELVMEFNFLELSGRKQDDHDLLFLLCKSGVTKDAIQSYHDRVQIVNRFVVAALIQSEPVLDALRRELRRIAPGTRVDCEDLEALLPDILKRDVLEGEQAAAARAQVGRAAKKVLRKKQRMKKAEEEAGEAEEEPTPPSSVISGES